MPMFDADAFPIDGLSMVILFLAVAVAGWATTLSGGAPRGPAVVPARRG